MKHDLKAYLVTEDYEGSCVIVFEKNGAAARSSGAYQLNLSFEEVDSCRRAHWADAYSHTQKIPVQAALDAGFWMECYHCGERIDYLMDEGSAVPVGFFNGVAFCSPGCDHDYDVDHAARNLAKAYGREVIRYKLNQMYDGLLEPSAEDSIFSPHVYVSKENGRYLVIELGLNFTFPGSKYGGTLKYKRSEESKEWHATVANGDLNAWNEFTATIPKAA